MDLNAQAVHITESFAKAGQYASFDSVLQNLLTWHGAPTFAHLPRDLLCVHGRVLTTAQELPVLNHLWRIEKHVKEFVEASLGTNDVVTFNDLERDVVAYLRGFLVPHLSLFKDNRRVDSKGQACAARNPEEINIDEIDDADELGSAEKMDRDEVLCSFENVFGLGPLRRHRSILHHFQFMGEKQLSESEIYKHLLCFLDRTSITFGNPATDVPLAEFGAFVAEAEGVSHYFELGFVLRPQASGRGLAAECQVIRHVQRRRMLRQAAAAEKILLRNDWADDGTQAVDASAKDVATRKRPRQESNSCSFNERMPVMVQPSKPKLKHFLDLCRERIRECTYSPSFTKMNEIVGQVVEKNHFKTKAAPSAKNKCKEKVGVISMSNDLLVEVATDWAMLHLGGGKYRRRSIQMEYLETASSKDELEKSEYSSDDDQSDNGDSQASEGEESVEVDHKPASALATFAKKSRTATTSSTTKFCAKENPLHVEVKRSATLPSRNHGWVITVSPSPVDPEEPAQLGANRSASLPGEALENNWSCLPWGLPTLDRSDGQAVGRWGEAFVNQLLLQKYPPATGAIVEWVNKNEETRAAYDLKVTFTGPNAHCTWGDTPVHPRRNETIFIEVKTTASDRLSTFELSLQEWDFATRRVGSSLVSYHVYRVYGAGNPSRVRVQIIVDILRSIEAKRVRLCLSV